MEKIIINILETTFEPSGTGNLANKILDFLYLSAFLSVWAPGYPEPAYCILSGQHDDDI